MDPKTLIHSLRALTPLNLVVSTEPTDVARLLAKVLGRITMNGNVRAVTRSGIIDIRAYLCGDSLIGNRVHKEQSTLDALDEVIHRATRKYFDPARVADETGRPVNPPPEVWGPRAEEVLIEAWHQDPKDEQFIYLMPDLWPSLSDPKVLAALQRIKDEGEVDPRLIKLVFVVVPSKETMPETFLPLFDIHYDTGLTEAQARDELAHPKHGVFAILETTPPDGIDEMVKFATGLSTAEVHRMVAYAITKQRWIGWGKDRPKHPLTLDGFAEWRKEHGYPTGSRRGEGALRSARPMTINEIYFSADVETDGPIPGPHSMLSFGVAAFKPGTEEPIATFEANLETLPGAKGHPATMAWWDTKKAAWEACRKDPQDPKVAMTKFVEWVNATCAPTKSAPVFAAYPAGFDFMFVYWYLISFTGDSPFSFSALDVKTYAMRVLGVGYRDVTKKTMPKAWFGKNRPHTHVALDDAIGQGILFMNMLKSTGR